MLNANCCTLSGSLLDIQLGEKKAVLTLSQTVGGKMPSIFKVLVPLIPDAGTVPTLQVGDEVYCESLIVYELKGNLIFRAKSENVRLIRRPLNQGTVEAEELFI